jgi:hypothetical protein
MINLLNPRLKKKKAFLLTDVSHKQVKYLEQTFALQATVIAIHASTAWHPTHTYSTHFSHLKEQLHSAMHVCGRDKGRVLVFFYTTKMALNPEIHSSRLMQHGNETRGA